MHTPPRLVAASLLASLSLAPAPANAVTRSWTGLEADNAKWTNASLWGGSVPTSADYAYLNTAGNYALIDSTVAATGVDIIVGRYAFGTRLQMTGGTLAPTANLILGQYTGSTGRFDLSGGTVNIGTDFTVGGQAPGNFYMTGGNVTVANRVLVQRYVATGAAGYAQILDGNLAAASLILGTAGDVTLDNATLTLNGNATTTLNAYINAGQITSFGGFISPLAVSYNATTNKTTLTAANGRRAGVDTFDASTLGSRSLSFDYSDVRRLTPAPPVGVHPRIYMGPDELPAVRARLATTAAGQKTMEMLRIYTQILRLGRNSVTTAQNTMPDGTARISNLGLYDRSAIYNDLIAGSTASLAATDSGGRYVLGGEMALEAFECYVNQGQSGYDTRAANLALALDSWALWAMNQPAFTASAGDSSYFAAPHSALSYDFAYGFMNDTQRADVRKALAQTMKDYFPSGTSPTTYTQVGIAPEATTSNWCTLDTFKFLVSTATEGELTVAEDNLASADVDAWSDAGMTSLYRFFTYGIYPTGAMYEGMGKNYLFATQLIPLAKRGYDFFGHPYIQALMQDFLPAMMAPYGYSWTVYDTIGGTGTFSPDKGGKLIQGSDIVALKWMFPADPAADFLWRNYILTPYKDSTGADQTFYDYRDTKFSVRDSRYNLLIPAAIFAQDIASTATWAAQNAAVQGSLDYLDNQGGTLVARSGFDQNAAELLFHVRQDFGGHTMPDRNTFVLSALGRLFVNLNGGASSSSFFESNMLSVVLADDRGMCSRNDAGTSVQPMAIPAKLAAWSSTANATFATGDATYAYSNDWDWVAYPSGSTFVPKTNYVADTLTYNSFRRSNNQLGDAYANTPFYQMNDWNVPGSLSGRQKKPYNPMRQVYRTIGLVRGVKPYVLCIDDVQKDDATHNYKWQASIPTDLTVATTLPSGANAATDVVLAEPSATGNRALLVRILRADGTPVLAGTATGGTALAYTDTQTNPNNETRPRLVIERAGTVAPNFLVLMFPFTAGDALPVTNLSGNTLTVTLGSQVDTYTFAPRNATVDTQTVTMREFTLSRGGSTLVDYRNQIEPGPLSAYTKIEAEAYSAMSGVQLQTCSDVGGGQQVAYVQEGDYTAYNAVNLTNMTAIDLRVSSTRSGSTVEVHVGSPTGTIIGTATVPNTGSWSNWTTVTCPISGATGAQNLYLVYHGTSPTAFLLNLNWLRLK